MADYSGYLYNSSGLPLINTKVVAHNAATAAVLATVYTDSTGLWDFGALSVIPTIYAYTEFGTRLVFRGEIVGTIGGSVDMVTSGAFRIGATAILTGDGFYTDYNAGTPRLRVGTVTGGALVKGVYWDGANLAWIGVNTSLTAAGLFTAANAVITGTITASAGAIGSFTIGTYLYTGSKTAWNDTNAGVHLGSDGLGIGNNVFTVNGSTGALVATSATITGAITASSGSFSGVMNVGASGGIFQGTGTFAVPTTALKIYNSGGVGLLEMWGSGTKQVYFGTDGALNAGAGAVKLNADGLSLTQGINVVNKVTWLSGASTPSYMGVSGATGTQVKMQLDVRAISAGQEARLNLQTFADSVDLHETSISINQEKPVDVANSNITMMVDQATKLELLTTHVHLNDDTQVTGYLTATTYLWAGTYAAVGFTSAPANTTAGDLTATRLFLSGAAVLDTTLTVAGVDFAAHASRHQNGGADEISVAGLSGLLADSQTPLSHGASLHTDVIREIPYHVFGTTSATGHPALPDEVATNYITVSFVTPSTWVAGTDVVIDTLWLGTSGTGLVDLEHSVQYGAYGVNDGGITTLVAAWTNVPVQPSYAAANRFDTVTITIAAANIAADRGFTIYFRRNTGDANTGTVELRGVRVKATLDM